jgi:hypothetical protein
MGRLTTIKGIELDTQIILLLHEYLASYGDLYVMAAILAAILNTTFRPHFQEGHPSLFWSAGLSDPENTLKLCSPKTCHEIFITDSYYSKSERLFVTWSITDKYDQSL